MNTLRIVAAYHVSHGTRIDFDTCDISVYVAVAEKKVDSLDTRYARSVNSAAKSIKIGSGIDNHSTVSPSDD